jgi:hypothetical protein
MPILGIMASQISGHLFGPTGAYDSIATTMVGGGGAASVTFSSIPATYTHLQIRLIARTDSGSTQGFIRLTYNNVTSANYTEHGLFGDGSTISANGASGDVSGIVQRTAGGTSLANTFGAVVIDVLDYASTNKYKTERSLGGVDLNGAGGLGLYSTALYSTTNAITRIDLTPNSGSFVEYSSFALYGIKGGN